MPTKSGLNKTHTRGQKEGQAEEDEHPHYSIFDTFIITRRVSSEQQIIVSSYNMAVKWIQKVILPTFDDDDGDNEYMTGVSCHRHTDLRFMVTIMKQ